jgi:archaellum biogenesis protein FlaJ (TadC family)
MTKKEKDKYYQDIKDKQKRYMKIVWIILGVLSALIFLFIIWALSQ